MLSDDKISHMSHVLLRGLLDKDIIDIIEDEGAVRKAIKKAINAQLKIGQEMDDAVRRKIESMQRHVSEGGPEWNVLYDKFLKEEEIKRGMSH
jgi:hypothetical protein